jgi:hypothetical protein
VAYQTFDGLQKMYGTKRLADATPMVASEALGTYWAAKLLAAQGMVEAYLRRAGYATPVDTSSLSVSDAAMIDALLADWTSVFALEMGAPAIMQTPKGVESAASKARTALRDLISGRLRLPLSINRAILGSVCTPEQRDDIYATPAPELDDNFFARMRNGWQD